MALLCITKDKDPMLPASYSSKEKKNLAALAYMSIYRGVQKSESNIEMLQFFILF